jgi:hypothetical protein
LENLLLKMLEEKIKKFGVDAEESFKICRKF